MPTPFGILNVDKPTGITSRDAVNRVERLFRNVKVRPCGDARSAGNRRAGDLRRPGHAADSVRPAAAEALSGRVPAGPQERDRRRRGRGRTGGGRTGADACPRSRRPCPNSSATFCSVRPPTRRSRSAANGPTTWPDAARSSSFRSATMSIHRLEILRYEYPELELAIECGSGTYVRSLGRDLAASLGTAAVMSALVRTAIGAFPRRGCGRSSTSSRRRRCSRVAAAARSAARSAADRANGKATRRAPPWPADRGASVSARRAAEASSPNAEWAADRIRRDDLAAILFEKHPNQLWPARNFEATR